jgi:cell division protein FtsB
VLRWAGVGLLVLVGLFYYRPIRAYLQTSQALESRRADIHALEAQRRELLRRLNASKTQAALAREARRLGYVRPGEHLYIVKGIDEWRHKLVGTVKGHG